MPRENLRKHIRYFAIFLVIFGLFYPISFFVPAYLYNVYISNVTLFEQYVEENNTEKARGLIDTIIDSYVVYNVSLSLCNILLIVLILLLLFELERIQVSIGWTKTPKMVRIAMVILAVLGFSVFLAIIAYTYVNVDAMREFLLLYIENPNEKVEIGTAMVAILLGYYLTYFVVGMVLLYLFLSLAKLGEYRKVLKPIRGKAKLMMVLSFFYMLEFYMPFKPTWVFMPVVSLFLARQMFEISRK